jgi:GR25 family glycosyltransferase involved in LPS biosynthesis
MVHLYVINLDRDTERWKNVQKQLPMFTSTAFVPQRISAVVGKTLDLNKINMSIRTKACMDEPRCGHESMNTMSEIGCYLSHYNVWKEFVNTKEEYCIVCEDDIIFNKKILGVDELYKKVQKFVGGENQPITIFISTLSIFYDKKNIDRLPELWRVTGRFFGTACYLINQPMANILIKNAFPMEVQVDSYIAFLAKLNKNLYMYHIKEPYAVLTGENSTIGHTDCNGCYLPISKNIIISMCVVGILIITVFAIIFIMRRKKYISTMKFFEM